MQIHRLQLVPSRLPFSCQFCKADFSWRSKAVITGSSSKFSSATGKPSGKSERDTFEALNKSSDEKATSREKLVVREPGESSYCTDLVRKHEYESFLCTLLLPGADIRAFMLAVRSFNVEIALIRDQISQKGLGIGRLIFWRDAINKLFQHKADNTSNFPRHPVVVELNKVLQGKSVSKKWFVNLMDARERVMNDAAFTDIADLESYCDKSVSPTLYLGLESLGVKNVDVDHAASHLGKAIGLSNFIRSIPYNAQRRRVLLPQEVLIKHKLSQENFIRLTNQEGIQDAVFEIATQAHHHYQKAKSLKKSIPAAALPLMLVGTPTEIYLKRLEREQFNPYHSKINRRNGLLPFTLYYRKLTRSYY